MMDYTHEILTAMVDRYERRKGTSAQNGKPQRAVTFDLAKYYPIYRDHLSEEEQAIDDAVTRLSSWQMVAAPRSAQGYYTKITLRLDHIQEIYEFLKCKWYSISSGYVATQTLYSHFFYTCKKV